MHEVAIDSQREESGFGRGIVVVRMLDGSVLSGLWV